MLQFNPMEQQRFNNIFGAHSSEYAQGVKDCKNGLGKQSNDPEYLKGFVHQVKVEAQKAKKRG